MELLIFRHGIAEEDDGAKPDAERRLTPRGVERTRQAARGLAKVYDEPNAILTSPKVRAAQTAEILAEVFKVKPEPFEPLAEADAPAIRRALRQRAEARVALVGHEPALSELIARLCGYRKGGGPIELKKAGCALLDAPLGADETHGDATLRWLIPARVLRALAGK